MQCLETTIGPEAYFALLTVAVGAVVRGVKRIKRVPADGLPVIAFVLGWALDTAASSLMCGLTPADAALSGLGGGLAGLAAAGGHEALSRSLSKVGLGGAADKLLGTSKREQDKRKSKGKSAALIVFAFVFLSGCSTLLPALAKAAQGAQYLGTVIDVADAGADAYFARHPNLDAERRVEAAMRRAHAALTALNRSLATAEAVADEDVTRARSEALSAYGALRDLLAELGVLTATPPAGGAETDAPEPEPLELPMPSEVPL